MDEERKQRKKERKEKRKHKKKRKHDLVDDEDGGIGKKAKVDLSVIPSEW